MERTSVVSSNIASIGYNLGNQTLEIEFLNGSVYQYFDVPQNIHEDLMSADSQGKYLAANIKGIFRYSRV